ncbi:MAG: spheroidene monooxygenase [Pseudomonadota bacterium]
MDEQSEIVSLSFYRFGGIGARTWAFTQMLFARFAMAKIERIGFWKLFGSGTGEGFTPLPNTAVYAILATWPSVEAAQGALEKTHVFQRYRAVSRESWTVFLATSAARGAWDGREPFHPVDTSDSGGPLAALTRATIRPSILLRFWKRVPSISRAIGMDRNVMFKIGLGEVPWFHQVTFSIWPDTSSMSRFARTDGPHAKAIKAVREGKWFKEELYARFRILEDSGTWNGASPLGTLTDGAVSR